MRLEDCPVKAALDAIGGKWKPLILFSLKDHKALRFGHLRKLVQGASQKVLTEQLRQLEASGIIERREFPGPVPHTEYSFTPYGETLLPVLVSLSQWGRAHAMRGKA
ncbi:MAG: helix-turn-helix transcriptional regulator [Acidobacteria bacterium]|nr:helix-turn-helix transcriptional regulator [Acidobacteriota bacterium]